MIGEQQPARGKDHEKILHPEERRLHFVQQAVQRNQVFPWQLHIICFSLESLISFNPFCKCFFQRNCEKDQGLGPCFPSQVGRPWHSFLKCVLTHQKPLILDYSIFRVDMSAAFLEKLWNIGIIPTKWSLENCDKVAPNTKRGISHGWKNQVTASSFCRRRLPVLMVRSKMAESVKSAVQVQSFRLDNFLILTLKIFFILSACWARSCESWSWHSARPCFSSAKVF